MNGQKTNERKCHRYQSIKTSHFDKEDCQQARDKHGHVDENVTVEQICRIANQRS